MQLFQLTEAEIPTRPVVVFGGRFQPYHLGHHAVYKQLCKHFGEDAVWVATSNKVTEDPSFLTFDERKRFMLKQGVREDRIAQTKNPAFAPHEIFKQFREPLAYIAVGGEKNAERYTQGDFFEAYPTTNGVPAKFDEVKDQLKPLSAKRGYYLLASPAGGGISGTAIRQALTRGDDKAKKAAFKKHLGEFDPSLYQLLQQKLSGVSEALSPIEEDFRRIALDVGKIVPLRRGAHKDELEGTHPSIPYFKLTMYKARNYVVVRMENSSWRGVGSGADTIAEQLKRLLTGKYAAEHKDFRNDIEEYWVQPPSKVTESLDELEKLFRQVVMDLTSVVTLKKWGDGLDRFADPHDRVMVRKGREYVVVELKGPINQRIDKLLRDKYNVDPELVRGTDYYYLKPNKVTEVAEHDDVELSKMFKMVVMDLSKVVEKFKHGNIHGTEMVGEVNASQVKKPFHIMVEKIKLHHGDRRFVRVTLEDRRDTLIPIDRSDEAKTIDSILLKYKPLTNLSAAAGIWVIDMKDLKEAVEPQDRLARQVILDVAKVFPHLHKQPQNAFKRLVGDYTYLGYNPVDGMGVEVHREGEQIRVVVGREYRTEQGRHVWQELKRILDGYPKAWSSHTLDKSTYKIPVPDEELYQEALHPSQKLLRQLLLDLTQLMKIEKGHGEDEDVWEGDLNGTRVRVVHSNKNIFMVVTYPKDKPYATSVFAIHAIAKKYHPDISHFSDQQTYFFDPLMQKHI